MDYGLNRLARLVDRTHGNRPKRKPAPSCRKAARSTVSNAPLREMPRLQPNRPKRACASSDARRINWGRSVTARRDCGRRGRGAAPRSPANYRSRVAQSPNNLNRSAPFLCCVVRSRKSLPDDWALSPIGHPAGLYFFQ